MPLSCFMVEGPDLPLVRRCLVGALFLMTNGRGDAWGAAVVDGRTRVSPGMPTEPNQPSSDGADPEMQSTPAGMTEELEERAESTGATTEPTPEG